MSQQLLEGVRVVDASTLAAGPLAATYLGEFGAEVIKVEQPQGGDPLRQWGNQRAGVGLMWKSISRNKKSMTLDLRLPEGRLVLRKLAGCCDVLIMNTRPGTLRRWELDYNHLQNICPDLVMLHVTGYGLAGPLSERPGFGTLGEALSGFAHITGPADGPPTLPPFMLADGVASLNAAYAIMMALYHRDVHNSGGQLIDINLIDPLARLLEQSVLTYDQLGTIPTRFGNRWDISAPRNTYRTKDDKWLALSGSAPSVAIRIFVAIGKKDLVEDADFSDPQRRLARAAEVDAIVAEWIAKHTLDDAMAVFESHEVAAAPVYDVRQLLEDDHFAQRGVFPTVTDKDLGAVRVQSAVPRFSAAAARLDHLGPALGAHTDEVLRTVLGASDSEIAGLRSRGVI